MNFNQDNYPCEENYQILINKLLKCPSGEEANILSQNYQFINQNLLEKMRQRAQLLQEIGNQEGNNFLNKLIFVIEDAQNYLQQPLIDRFHNGEQKFEQKKREEQLYQFTIRNSQFAIKKLRCSKAFRVYICIRFFVKWYYLLFNYRTYATGTVRSLASST
ncbi:hypothetical protein ACQFX9_01480 [Aliinostoc sp. HNIBRCY26]|uniref:hypothetical protein n=1 Tax=Aliinostoc sp. HNIBRCY26 TaxID=3418997 RepID=UPI003CFC87D1